MRYAKSRMTPRSGFASVLRALHDAKVTVSVTVNEGICQKETLEGQTLVLMAEVELLLRALASNLATPTQSRLAAMRSADYVLDVLIQAGAAGMHQDGDVSKMILPVRLRPHVAPPAERHQRQHGRLYHLWRGEKDALNNPQTDQDGRYTLPSANSAGKSGHRRPQ